MVECYAGNTDWPDIITSNATTIQITTALRQEFCKTAIPDVLWYDGGPQFSSHQFTQLAWQQGFHPHTTPKVTERLNLQSNQ